MTTKGIDYKNALKQIKISIFFICCFIGSSQVGEAQPYESVFGEDSTSFYIVRGQLWGDIPEYFRHTTGTDTLVNNEKYSIFTSDYYQNTRLLLREDTANGSVYMLDQGSNSEKLIMDLSLTVGDSFYLGVGPSSTGYYEIDSAYQLNNKKHVRLNMKIREDEKLLFIEGVGTNIGLTYKISTDYFSSYLICSWKDDSNTFGSKYYEGDCDPEIKTGTIDRTPKQNTISVYPNPAHHEIRIAGDQNERFKAYRVLSVDGRLVKSGRLTNEQVISAKEISSGLYVVVLLHDEGNITRKIVIE